MSRSLDSRLGRNHFLQLDFDHATRTTQSSNRQTVAAEVGDEEAPRHTTCWNGRVSALGCSAVGILTAASTLILALTLALSLGTSATANAATKTAINPHTTKTANLTPTVDTVGNANGNPEAYCNFLSGDHSTYFAPNLVTDTNWTGPFVEAGTGLTTQYANALLYNDNLIRSTFNADGLYNDTSDGETGSPIPMLTTNTALTTEAQDFANCLASSYGNGAFDNPALIKDAEAAGYPTGYISENVVSIGGAGEGTTNYSQALFADAAHYPQIINPYSNNVGIGVACDNYSYYDPGYTGAESDQFTCYDVEDFGGDTGSYGCEPGATNCSGTTLPPLRLPADNGQNETACDMPDGGASTPCLNFENDIFNAVSAQMPGGITNPDNVQLTGTPGAGTCTVSFPTPEEYGDPVTSYEWDGDWSTQTTVSTTDFSNNASTGETTVVFHVPAAVTFGGGYVIAESDLGPGEADEVIDCDVTKTSSTSTPDAPTSVEATATNTGITASWSPPASDNGSSITGYVVTVFTGSEAQGYATIQTVDVPATSTSVAIPGYTDSVNAVSDDQCGLYPITLLAGCSYLVTVSAVNGLGQGPGSDYSNSVVAGNSNGAPVCSEYGATTEYETELSVAAPGVLGSCSGVGDSVVVDSGPSDGQLSLNSDGSFTYTPNAGFVGQDSFTYTVTNTEGKTATFSATITVEGLPTTSILTMSPEKAVYGQPLAFDVSVTSPDGTPTGSVTITYFSHGTCEITLVNGSGSCRGTATPSVRTSPYHYAVRAVYEPTGVFGTSSTSQTLTVDRSPTTTKLTEKGEKKTVVFTVKVASSYKTPTGLVEVYDGRAKICGVRLKDGTASCSMKRPTKKTVAKITARFEATSDYGSSQVVKRYTIDR